MYNEQYEFLNHLGSVLTTVSDKPIPHNNSGSVDYFLADIKTVYDYSPFGFILTGRNFSVPRTECYDSIVNVSDSVLAEGFGTWFSWSTMGNGLLTYVSGQLQVSNPNSSQKNIGAYKTFTTGSGLHSVSFKIINNTCATVVLWPPSSTPKIINVYVRDAANNIVATGNYTAAGTYNLSFTPATSGATYKIEFYMANASAFCFFQIDDVLITHESTSFITQCETKESNYSRQFQGQEREREITSGTYSAEFWMYESRLGRRWNIDPVFKEYESPYAAFANNPIWFVDPNGADTLLDNSSRDLILDMINPKSDNFNKKFADDFNVLVNDHSTVYKFENWKEPQRSVDWKTKAITTVYGLFTGEGRNENGQSVVTIGYSMVYSSQGHKLESFFEEFDHALQFNQQRIGFKRRYISDINNETTWDVIGYDQEDEIDNKLSRVKYLTSFNEKSAYNIKLKGLNKSILESGFSREIVEVFVKKHYNFEYIDNKNVYDLMHTTKESLIQDFRSKENRPDDILIGGY